jgi:hypothetical protein
MRKLLLFFVCKQNKTGHTNEAQANKILPLTRLDQKHLTSFGLQTSISYATCGVLQ